MISYYLKHILTIILLEQPGIKNCLINMSDGEYDRLQHTVFDRGIKNIYLIIGLPSTFQHSVSTGLVGFESEMVQQTVIYHI